MARQSKVERPTKKSEYEIRFATRQAQKGWLDLKATIRNSLVDSWDFLTQTPAEVTPVNYPMRGQLAQIVRGDERFERWQHKPTLKGDARIWFYICDGVVYLEQVHTHHPNETK